MPDYSIPNLRNACRVLRFLGEQTAPQSLSEIVDALKLPRTTVLRIAETLFQEGFASKVAKRYALGPTLGFLGQQADFQQPLFEIARPYMEQLTQITDETSHLAQLVGAEV